MTNISTIKQLKVKFVLFFFFIFILLLININPVQAANWNQIASENKDAENIEEKFKLAVALANLGDVKTSYRLFDSLADEARNKNLYEANKSDKNQDNILLLNYGAFSALIQDNHDNAAKYFSKLLKLFPDNIHYSNYLASCYIELNKYEEAEVLLKNALKIDDNDFTHLLLGVINYERGNMISALLEFSRSGDLFKTLLNEVN